LIVVVGQGCRQRSWEVAGDSHPLHRGINGVEQIVIADAHLTAGVQGGIGFLQRAAVIATTNQRLIVAARDRDQNAGFAGVVAAVSTGVLQGDGVVQAQRVAFSKEIKGISSDGTGAEVPVDGVGAS